MEASDTSSTGGRKLKKGEREGSIDRSGGKALRGGEERERQKVWEGEGLREREGERSSHGARERKEERKSVTFKCYTTFLTANNIIF